jgi:hypothetical protein
VTIIVLFNLALQKVIQSIKVVPSVTRIGNEQLSYVADIALIWKSELEIRQLFVKKENIARKLRLHINHGKTKYMILERKISLKQNEIWQLIIKNYIFERVENFKYLGVIVNGDNNHQKDLQEIKK